MELEIKEPAINRYMRVLIKSLFLFSIFWGLLLVIFSIATKQTLISIVLALALGIVYYYYHNIRIAKVKLVRDRSVVLSDGKNDVELTTEDISYISKFVRFTLTGHFLLSIVVKKDGLLSSKRYLFLNDPQSNLIEVFKNMNIDLRNIP